MAKPNDLADAFIAEGNGAEDSGRLQEACASTPEGYVRLAVQFARDGALLAELRRSLRQKMRLSPIMEEAAFVHDLESVYRAMWRAWCEGRN